MKPEIVEQNKILELRVGSHLYGTNTENSDEDFCGVFIPPINYYFGLDSVNEADLSIKSKLENGRNSKDAIDRKFYELRKFVKLAIDNNPSIIEMLFVNKENIVFYNYFGEALLDNKHLFPYKECYHRFKGYAISQTKKMLVKSGNMKDLKLGLDLLEEVAREEISSKYMFEVESILCHSPYFGDNGNQHLLVGDIYIQKNITIKRAIEQIQERVSKFGNRKDLVEDYGFDVKFASHSVRLLKQCKELLDTGEIVFPLKEKDLILDIKRGKYNLQEVNDLIEDCQADCDISFEKSELPKKPRYDEINKLLMRSLKDWFHCY